MIRYTIVEEHQPIDYWPANWPNVPPRPSHVARRVGTVRYPKLTLDELCHEWRHFRDWFGYTPTRFADRLGLTFAHVDRQMMRASRSDNRATDWPEAVNVEAQMMAELDPGHAAGWKEREAS